MPLMNLVSAGGIGKATVTGTTGSPTVDTSSRAGKTIYKFTGSGSITIGSGGTCEVLVVGGGGAGGNNHAGGGGAGGYIYNETQILPAGTLTVTVGAGGSGYTSSAAWSQVVESACGTSSRLENLFAFGGGNGGGGLQLSSGDTCGGMRGGSGGGDGRTGRGPGPGVPGQGNRGGNSPGGLQGGGGGGAGAAGTTSGGVGLQNSITGTATYYAGGGGSGSSFSGPGGLGGGGAGGAGNNAGVSGTANTGGGGGGDGGGGAGSGSGGSGIIIVVIG